jgi:hypothetical protein
MLEETFYSLLRSNNPVRATKFEQGQRGYDGKQTRVRCRTIIAVLTA